MFVSCTAVVSLAENVAFLCDVFSLVCVRVSIYSGIRGLELYSQLVSHDLQHAFMYSRREHESQSR